jgi:hypothetical protein
MTSEGRHRVLSAAGWSENDFAMLRQWFFTSHQMFGVERLGQAVVALGTNGARTPARPTPLLDAWATIRREGLAPAFAFAPLAALGFLGLRRIGYALYGSALVIAIVAVLAALFKEPPLRILWPLLTLHAAFVLLHDRGHRPRGVLRTVPLVVVGVVSAWPVWHELSRASANRAALAQATAEDVARLADPRRLRYVILGGSFPYEHYFRAMKPTPPEDQFRFIGLGVGNLTPLVQDFLGGEGMEDLALALCTDETLRFIGSGRDIVERFVAEHFGLVVRMRADFEGRTFATHRCEQTP